VSREHVAARDVNYECATDAAAGRLQTLLLVGLVLALGAARRSRQLTPSASV
jgi:hypothetical protein